MSIFTDIKKSKLGDSLHGFRALWEGLKATSPEYQTFRNLRDLRDFAQGDIGLEEFLKSGKQDFQEGLKHNWPIILGSLASMGAGGLGAGGGGSQGLPVFGVEGGMTGTGASVGSTFGGGGMGIGSSGGLVQSGLGGGLASTPLAQNFNQRDIQRLLQNRSQQQQQETERERRLRESNQLIAMILANG